MSTTRTIQAESFRNFPRLQFGMSTRVGGVSPATLGMNLSFSVGDDEANVKQNRELFRLNELAIPRQVHSATVVRAHAPGSYAECDALITDQRRVFLCVSVADCVPVFVLDTKKRVIAGIHAGWRGTAGNIVSHSIDAMKREFASDPSDMIAFVGPSAGLCCYSVGGEVAAQFDHEFVHHLNGKVFVDLKLANASQLVASGVSPSAIEISPLCTITESTLLHSFRRDKEHSGRMMGVIGLL
jgi:YfiH family protein